MNILNNKKILIIICGGISAYKTLEVIRKLKKEGSAVKTILTKSAEKFVTRLSVASLSQKKSIQIYLITIMKVRWIISFI